MIDQLQRGEFYLLPPLGERALAGSDASSAE